MTSRRIRRTVGCLVAVAAVLAVILVGCPSYRDGMSGQLFTAKGDTSSAARSAVLAIQLWGRHASTGQLTAVQLSDARDHVVEAYQTVASLRAENPTDLARQNLLTRAMTDVIGELEAANAGVRAVAGQPDPRALARQLADRVDALERDYR